MIRSWMIAAGFALGFASSALAQEASDDGIDGDYVRLEAGEKGPPQWSEVTFDIDRDKMKVSTILGRSVGSAGGQTVVATSYQDLCTTPCRLSMRPGLRTFSVYGQGRTPSAIELDLRRGSEHLVRGKTGPIAARLTGSYIRLLSAIAVITGATILAVDLAEPDPEFRLGVGGPILAGGLGGVAVSIPFTIVGRSKLTEE